MIFENNTSGSFQKVQEAMGFNGGDFFLGKVVGQIYHWNVIMIISNFVHFDKWKSMTLKCTIAPFNFVSLDQSKD